MKISEKELQGLIPNIRGLVDPKVETRINEAFRRVYEYMLLKLDEQGKSYQDKIAALESASAGVNQQLNTLVGAYSQPLIGGTPDPLLQNFSNQFGPQLPLHFLGGPTPSFRPIVTQDIANAALGLPKSPADKLDADGTILDVNVINNGEFLKRVGATVVSAPITIGPASQLDSDGTTLDVNVITDGQYLRRVGSTVVSGIPQPDFSVRCSNSAAALAIPNNSAGPIPFDFVYFNTQAMWAAGTNTRITCKLAGKYWISGHAHYYGNVTGYRQIIIILNGASALAYSQVPSTTASGQGDMLEINVLRDLIVGDYVELYAFQNSGAPLNIVGSSGAASYYTPIFSAIRIA